MKKCMNLKVLIFSCLLFISFSAVAQVSSLNYVDLTTPAEQSVHAVVHIKTIFRYQTSLWDDFFGESFWSNFFGNDISGGVTEREVMGAGSGVIISADGYIVTNNHVVEQAESITVTLNNKREYVAKVIGTDPQTDLALIKIDCDNLPYLTFGNSDQVRIGEWVLAVGNPFNLTSTVTAGIVSAKARNLSILGENSAVESFIQTDAAVNQGNSGGALVNAKGELIGINSAIASGNGYYTGYSFAIPSNIAKKITFDLKNYGFVQRAYLGLYMMEIDSHSADELGLTEVKGIVITGIIPSGAGEIADLRANDILLSIDGKPVNSVSEFREIIAQHSPGDTIHTVFLRNNVELSADVTLLNNIGNTEILREN